jgi:hypothetical protein
MAKNDKPSAIPILFSSGKRGLSNSGISDSNYCQQSLINLSKKWQNIRGWFYIQLNPIDEVRNPCSNLIHILAVYKNVLAIFPVVQALS